MIEVIRLSDEVRDSLAHYGAVHVNGTVENHNHENDSGLGKTLFKILHDSEVLCEEPSPIHRMVFRWNEKYVIKLKRHMEDFTEHTSLQHLAQHAPTVPVPKSHGILKMSGYFFAFMSYIPVSSLESAWGRLDEREKSSVRDQLDVIFTQIRSLPYAEGSPLGGVAGEGCKDLRRHLRKSNEQIFSCEAFEEFQFSNPHFGSSVYINFLRQLLPPIPSTCVFSHGDLRPDNIMVTFIQNNRCVVSGIIDWEYSGYYPEHYESTKVTNCMATNDNNDWYLYLPPSISPKNNPNRWLLDRLWDEHIA